MGEQEQQPEWFSGQLVRLDLLDGRTLHRLHLTGDDGRRFIMEIEPPTSGLTLELQPTFYLDPVVPFGSNTVGPAPKVRITEDR